MKKQVLVKSAKEQFDEAVKCADAKYADEVCGYDYYYNETSEQAVFYFGNEQENDYSWGIYPTFKAIKEKYGVFLASYFAEMELGSSNDLSKLDKMSINDLFEDNKFFTTYCDFLFAHGGIVAIDGGCYHDEYEEQDIPDTNAPEASPSGIIGVEYTDINAISSMVEFLKTQLITKIKTAFCNCDKEVFRINPVYNNNQYFNEIVVGCGHEFYIVEDRGDIRLGYESDYSSDPLTMLNIEELLCIYSQLHN